MSESIEKVLLATDGSRSAALAGRAAADIADRMGAELHAIHVWQEPPGREYARPVAEYLSEVATRQEQEVLERQIKDFEASGARITEVHRRSGAPIEEVIGLAVEIGAGLIVVGSRGMGALQRFVLGSVSEGIAHHARCPVLVVRGGEEAWPPDRLVIADDGSEPARKAGDLAASIGGLFGMKGVLVRVHHKSPVPLELPEDERDAYDRTVRRVLDEEESNLKSRASELEKILGGAPEIELLVDDPSVGILGAADDSESVLIAVGSRGLGPVSRVMLGSVSSKVLRGSRGPVLIHPHT